MKIVSVIPALVDLFSIYAYFHHIPIHIVITLHALAEVSPPLNTMPILPLPHHICSQLDHHPVLLTLVVAISIIEPAYELKPTQQLQQLQFSLSAPNPQPQHIYYLEAVVFEYPLHLRLSLLSQCSVPYLLQYTSELGMQVPKQLLSSIYVVLGTASHIHPYVLVQKTALTIHINTGNQIIRQHLVYELHNSQSFPQTTEILFQIIQSGFNLFVRFLNHLLNPTWICLTLPLCVQVYIDICITCYEFTVLIQNFQVVHQPVYILILFFCVTIHCFMIFLSLRSTHNPTPLPLCTQPFSLLYLIVNLTQDQQKGQELLSLASHGYKLVILQAIIKMQRVFLLKNLKQESQLIFVKMLVEIWNILYNKFKYCFGILTLFIVQKFQQVVYQRMWDFWPCFIVDVIFLYVSQELVMNLLGGVQTWWVLYTVIQGFPCW